MYCRQERTADAQLGVLVVPYFCDSRLKEYRFDEPWDSPHNQSLCPEYPTYRCPCDRDSSVSDTSYVMVVGPQTISDGPTPTTRKGITDGPSDTIMIVEMCDSGIHWMEPRDLSFDEMTFKINDRERPGSAADTPASLT